MTLLRLGLVPLYLLEMIRDCMESPVCADFDHRSARLYRRRNQAAGLYRFLKQCWQKTARSAEVRLTVALFQQVPQRLSSLGWSRLADPGLRLQHVEPAVEIEH